MEHPDVIKRKRVATGICILVLIPLGIIAKEYHGPYEYYISDKLAGSLYILFWSLLTYFLFYRIRIFIVVLVVFIGTCSLEFLQLVSCPLLDAVRSNYIGRAMIGSSFAWSDFVFYLLGSIVSYIIIGIIKRRI